ncbi:MAG TPA: hypothetical protein PLV13_00675 [Ilumatobacteraceae bacterium]|nr:hypothetical protein [Ilumatobacteraceae bacterium]
MQRDTWPLIGRDELVGRVLRHLSDPGCDGVFLVGGRGVGTTRVLHEVHGRLRASSRPTTKAVASQAHRSTPFAALVPTFPADVPSEPVALFQHLRHVAGSPRPHERRRRGAGGDGSVEL